jgi:enoyl-CoA hydratase/carnithine racemase
MASAVRTETEAGIARITIDRPETRNALDSGTVADLTRAVCALQDDPAVRVVILCGGGDRVFVSGADVREFKEKLATPDQAMAYDEEIEALHGAIRRMTKPVIAEIQGFAIGGGCVLAVACDFRFASDKGKFGIPIAKFGFMLSVPDTVRFAELVGLGAARRLLMTGEIIGAAEAERIGLVDRVVPHDRLRAETEAFARTLAQNSPLSIGATKEMLEDYAAWSWTVADGQKLYDRIFTSTDLKEGLSAFFEKRAPQFKGR